MPKSRHSKHRHKSSRPSGSLFLDVPKELRRIDDLIAEGELVQALQDVKDLARRAPHRADVFETMLLIAVQMKDVHELLEAALRLAELQPYVPAHHYNLYSAYLQNNYPALAIQTGRYFLSRWPDSKLKDDMPEQIRQISEGLREQPLVAQFPEDTWLEIFALHERIGVENARGHTERAIALATQLLAQAPNFIPAYNNRSVAHWLMGNTEAALADVRRVLELEPDNFHALGNLARLQRLDNRLDEARATAARLKELQSLNHEIWVKQAETFACFPDDAAVLELAKRAEAEGLLAKEYMDPLLFYYAGVAAARLGNEKKARSFFNRALERRPSLSHVREQLQDLDKPKGEREGAWALTIDHWVPRKLTEEFMKILDAAARAKNPESAKTAARKYLESHPQIAALVPVMLERGDPVGRMFAQQLARLAATPEMLQALKDFALSANGTDRVRHEVLIFLQKAGVFAEGEKIPFWSRGKLTEISLIDYTIDDVPYEQLDSSPAGALLKQALLALAKAEPLRAEELLQEAWRLEPGSASIPYNLAMAYLEQGQVAKSRQLTEQIVAEHPNYGFARCQLALFAIANGNKEKAREQLRALSGFKHFHLLEYGQFCKAQVFFYVLFEPESEGAERWLGIWKKALPDDPGLKSVRPLLDNRLMGKARAWQILAQMRE